MLILTDQDGDKLAINLHVTDIEFIAPRRIMYGNPADHRGEWKLGAIIKTTSGQTIEVAETVSEVIDLVKAAQL